MIAFPSDDRELVEQLRPWLLSLLREGNPASIARFDIDFIPCKVFAWQDPRNLNLQLQCWRLEELRKQFGGKVQVR